ncbi:MAG: ribonuclease III [Candidatus Niyogibacteria bacterium]|nr:ribonuclease III [Candidatus Niyogibacteria bacterium]
MTNFSKFEKKLKISFENQALLFEALTHRSYLNENPSWGYPHNERLEFLGDAVLELAVTDHLFRNFPDKPEGDLTSIRAALVNASMLATVATEIGINDVVLLSRGEAKDVGRARASILANAFEALVGALYLDGGYPAADAFIQRQLIPKTADILEKKLFRDAKSVFQEKAQEMAALTPAYRVQKEWGPDHDKHFVVGAYIGEELIGEGEGPSKQIAEQNAAENALRAKDWQ